MDDNLLNKAKKILEHVNHVSHGGSDLTAEKENAQRLLDEFLTKYGLTISDLEDNPRTPHKFYGTRRKDDLLFQVIMAVMKTAKVNYSYSKSGEHWIQIDCTEAEAAQIRFQLDFYWAALQKEYKAFFHAFCVRNHLYHQGESDPDKVYTAEELAYFRKVLQYTRTINNKTHHTPIENG